MLVTVAVEDLDTIENHGSVIAITGTTEDNTRVTFAGDTRVMGGLIEWVEEAGDTLVQIEAWQVLGTVQPAA
ncbi:hypothetical protein EV284_3489 [Streptomyces sp. BK022]|uniref:hypothetical protein n=1 Tax=Streptomyces sp. BK022 TaxID=2512123 RepID=UPI001028BCDE|nr:hypothetical protein [Streptomyces sp. BK022]RZU36006.1 hypothetical protein EV284_3489 [Streptomyces sp. BK022]